MPSRSHVGQSPLAAGTCAALRRKTIPGNAKAAGQVCRDGFVSRQANDFY
jgi:hypothetical protein